MSEKLWYADPSPGFRRTMKGGALLGLTPPTQLVSGSPPNDIWWGGVAQCRALATINPTYQANADPGVAIGSSEGWSS